MLLPRSLSVSCIAALAAVTGLQTTACQSGCGTTPAPRRVRGPVAAPGGGIEVTCLGRPWCSARRGGVVASLLFAALRSAALGRTRVLSVSARASPGLSGRAGRRVRERGLGEPHDPCALRLGHRRHGRAPLRRLPIRARCGERKRRSGLFRTTPVQFNVDRLA